MSAVESPIRYPDTSSPKVMTRRAWVLVVLNFVLPGSAQTLAGNRKLGRFGLRATLSLWAVAIASLISFNLWQAFTITLFTASWMLWAVAIVAVFYAVLWVILTIDTLRLVKLVKTGPKSRWILAVFAIASMIVVSGTAAYASQVALSTNQLISNVFDAGPSQPPVNGRYNFLVLGGDAGDDRVGLRPDSAMVVSVDATTGQTTTIGIPRDLHNITFPAGSVGATLYPDGYTEASADYCVTWACFNTLYTDGELNHQDAYASQIANGIPAGVAETMEAAEGVTGLTIQYYVLIDMQGFQNLIDSLGGVDICVEQRIPIVADEDSEPQEWIEAGCQHLDGYHALWYGRARHQIGDGDYGRMQRQATLEQAIVDQFTPAAILSKFQGIASAGTQVVSTNIPQSMLGYFVTLGEKARATPITRVELIPANGVDPQEPDYSVISALIQAGLNPPTPSATPTPNAG